MAIMATIFGGWQYIQRTYFPIESAVALEKKLSLNLAQSASELQSDIQAIRLANIVDELEALEARALAGKALPGDTTRRRQLEERMSAIIAGQEK